MAAWMAYTIVVTVLAGIAATGMERALRLFHIPARWTWTAAIALGVGLPLWSQFSPTAPPAVNPVSGAVLLINPEALLDLLGATAAAPSLVNLDVVLAALWIGASLLIAATLLASQLRIRREALRWPVENVDGVAIRITPDLGPAVIGGFRNVIVLPTWIKNLDPNWQNLVVSHEREHVRAGDSTLLFAGLVAAVLVPWNLPLWWQLRRLRDAVELDCDERLLRAGANVRAYSELLLEITRQGKRPLVAPALSNPKSLLARRIHMMTQKAPRARWPRAGLASAVATVFIGLACEMPTPAVVAFDEATGSATGVSQVLSEADVDVRPERLSGPVPRYPQMLREAGVEGMVLLDFVIDASGRVDSSSITVLESTNGAFVAPATDVIQRSLYQPGELDGEPVAVRVQQRIGFSIQRPDRDVLTLQTLIEGAQSGRTSDTSLVFVSILMYIDGVEATDDDVSGLTPDMISRIEVLKGAAAEALYGERAANGVIQIYTKMGDISVTGRPVNR